MEQYDALLRAIAARRRLEYVDELHERKIEPVERVLAVADRVLEKAIVDDLLLVLRVLLEPVGQYHVVEPLERGVGHLRISLDRVHVVGEAALPVELLVALDVVELLDHLHQVLDLRILN